MIHAINNSLMIILMPFRARINIVKQKIRYTLGAVPALLLHLNYPRSMFWEYLPPVILTGYDLVTDPKNTPPKSLNLYAYLDEFPRVFQINILSGYFVGAFYDHLIFLIEKKDN